MTIRIIDNKRVDLTEEEYLQYQKIVKSYNSPTNRGEDLFIDLFETNQDGVIVMLKPPSKYRTSFEIFLFLMSIQQQQHIRVMYSHIDDMANQIKSKIGEIDQKLSAK